MYNFTSYNCIYLTNRPNVLTPKMKKTFVGLFFGLQSRAKKSCWLTMFPPNLHYFKESTGVNLIKLLQV